MQQWFCFLLIYLFAAGSSKKTKEVGAGVIIHGQRGRPHSRHRTAEQGGQRRHANAGGQEDGREDGDAAQRVRGHHHYCGVHRSGSSAHHSAHRGGGASHPRLVLFQDHGITALSEVCYSTRQTVSPVSINRRVSSSRTSARRITFLLYLFADARVCAQVHVSGLSRESAGSPILVAENVTSATTHVTKVEERAEPRLVPLLRLFEGKSFCVADGEGGILRDADREEDHNHRRRRRGPGTGTGTLHLSAHMYILIVPCFPSGPGYCNTGSKAAASRHAGDQGGCCQGKGIVH